jgi:hypothetical protein
MPFVDAFECYQAIAQELSSIIPEPWSKVDVQATRYDSSVNLEIVYERPDGSRESNVDPIHLDEYFFDLADLVSAAGKGCYKTCTFRLGSDGQFKVDFLY